MLHTKIETENVKHACPHCFFLLLVRQLLAARHCGYQVRDLLEMLSYVLVDERVPGGKGVEPANEHDNLLGNRAAS